MAGAVMRWLLALLLATWLPVCAQPLVRLDHIPTAVHDLDAATADFQAFGFAIKPGRPHANGLRNAHIKFANGAGLELITVANAGDALSARYVDFLREGEGPAYLTLHASDLARAAAALQAAGIPHRYDADGLALSDPRLSSWIFFAGDNRSPTDRPEHFVHGNGAFATREVWVALDDAKPLAQLLTALGARPRGRTLFEPFKAAARVFDLDAGGRIAILPAGHQLVHGHPLIAVVMAARDGKPRWWPPEQAHGLWLGLRPDTHREVQVDVPAATQIPSSCIAIESGPALIHLDQTEVASDAAYRPADDPSIAETLGKLRSSRASRLLAVLPGEPTNGCQRQSDYGLHDIMYYVADLIDRGHAAIMERGSGALVPYVTRVDGTYLDRYGGAFREYRSPSGRYVLAFRTAVR